ncbi:tetratricopeptide repeat protein, partial [Streptomyces cyaneofuscatus]|uniref:tetratricopeptide repeat protein n=1 Tax=Streptomyces cyaneofuscatus TaxID=66883 RepID=UPI0036D8DAC1
MSTYEDPVIGPFTDRVEALEGIRELAQGHSQLRALVVWGMSGQGKTTLLSHVHATGWADAKYGLAQLSHLIDPALAADGHAQGTDLARTLLGAIAEAIAELCPPEVGQGLMRDYRNRQKETRAERNVHVYQGATRSSRISNSPITVDSPSPVGEYARYRESLVDALIDLAEAAAKYPGIVLIDTSELLRLADQGARRDPGRADAEADLDSWFTASVLKRLASAHPELRFVVAGREPLDLPIYHARIKLTEWELGDTEFFLLARGIPKDLTDTVHALCDGTPVWTAMTADLILQAQQSAQPVTAEALRIAAADEPAAGWLTAKYLERLSDNEQQRLMLAAIPRSLTHELLDRITTHIGCTARDFQSLTRHSFIHRTPQGKLQLHPLVRSAITSYLRTHHPKKWRDAHATAAAYFEAAGALAEVTYHQFAATESDAHTKWWHTHVTEALDESRPDEANLLIDAVFEAVGTPLPLALRAHASYFRGRTEYLADKDLSAEGLLRHALELYQQLEDRLGQANALNYLGSVARMREDLPTAEELLRQAMKLYRELEDHHGQARTLALLGSVAAMREDLPAAEELLSQAMKLYQESGNRRGQALVFNILGDVAGKREDLPTAEKLQGQALKLYQKLEDHRGQAYALASLGDVAGMRKDLPVAESLQRRALKLYQELEDHRGQANALVSLGDIAGKREDLPTAEQLLLQALELSQKLEDHRGQANALVSLMGVAATREDLPAVEELLGQALELFRKLEDRRGQAHVLNLRGDVAVMRGDLLAAESLQRRALKLYQELEDHRGQANALVSLGDIAGKREDLPTAEQLLLQAL